MITQRAAHHASWPASWARLWDAHLGRRFVQHWSPEPATPSAMGATLNCCCLYHLCRKYTHMRAHTLKYIIYSAVHVHNTSELCLIGFSLYNPFVHRGPKYHLLAHTTLTLLHVQDSFRTHDLTITGNGKSTPLVSLWSYSLSLLVWWLGD